MTTENTRVIPNAPLEEEPDIGSALTEVPGVTGRFLERPWIWVVPVIVGAVARITYWAFVTPRWIPNSDADQYLRLAWAIKDGNGYSLVFPQLDMHATAFRPPLYPILLSFPVWVFGDNVLWPARLFSLLLSLGVIALTVVFLKRIIGPVAALIAGLVVAVAPNLLANDTVTLTEPLALLLLLALLIMLDERKPIATGLLTGLLFLTRPNAYLILTVAVVVLWRWVGWRRAALCIACCAAVTVPWLIRNKVQVGTFRATTSDGFTIAAIYAPPAREAGGFVDPVLDDWYVNHDDGSFKLMQFDEADWSAELTRLSIKDVISHPGYPFVVLRRNIASLLEIETTSNRDADRLDGRNIDFVKATLPVFYLTLVMGAAGLWLERRNRRLWPAYAVVAAITLPSLFLVAPPRLRSPMDLLLCIGVGLLVHHIHRTHWGRTSHRPVDTHLD